MNNGTKPDSGKVIIHGKEYSTVALRVQKFRELFKDHSLETEIVCRDIEVVAMKAIIRDPSGRILSTGHAEEYRSSSTINKTSALENAETSAIGRALAGIGLGGTEYASADEVAHAMTNKPAVRPAAGVIKPSDGAMESLTRARQQVVVDTATLMRDALDSGKDFDALGLCESITDPDEVVALYTLFPAPHRARLKAASKAAADKPAADEWKRSVGA